MQPTPRMRFKTHSFPPSNTGAVQEAVTDVDMAHYDCYELCADAVAQTCAPDSLVSGRTDRRRAERSDTRTAGSPRTESRRRVSTFRTQCAPEASRGTALASLAQNLPAAAYGWSDNKRSSTHPGSSNWNREGPVVKGTREAEGLAATVAFDVQRFRPMIGKALQNIATK